MKSLLLLSILSLFLLIPDNSHAGMVPTLPPVPMGCCDFEGMDCNDYDSAGGLINCLEIDGDPRPGESCMIVGEQSARCSGLIETTRNVPTMSEWGLIAMAAVMGFIGYMLLRRRKSVA